MLILNDMADLFPVNHYGLPTTDEEVRIHRGVVPAETPVADVVSRLILEANTQTPTVASFALQHGIDALFLP